MTHFSSVFNNSCVKVPLDPKTKMPTTEYERKERSQQQRSKNRRSSVDSNSTNYSLSKVDIDAKQVREFYESIPDYNDINHLPQEDFNSTLKLLREKKRKMLGHAIIHLDDENGDQIDNHNIEENEEDNVLEEPVKEVKSKLNNFLRTSYENDRNPNSDDYSLNIKKITDNIDLILADEPTPNKLKMNRLNKDEPKSKAERVLSPKQVVSVRHTKEPNVSSESRPKRNHSACSRISWNDQCLKYEDIDNRFDKYFHASYTKVGNERKSRSMPSSPIKVRRILSPDIYKKNGLTVPKPFNMTLRDEDNLISNNLKCLTKSFSEEMLDRKVGKKRFRSRPVPIESRIPLYDKIMEDQAMRRAISKINSTAELQAQMKPFSFTEREELRPKHTCDRHDAVIEAENVEEIIVPKTSLGTAQTTKKKFRARPIPKNLFSNYIYEKIRDDEFYRALNRRIRAEELLRNASLPPSMAARNKPASHSRMSTPVGLLSDLPTDTTSDLSSNKSVNGKRSRKKRNSAKGKTTHVKQQLQNLITTSPQPFRFSTADRASRKESTKKIYSPTRRSPTRSTANMTQARPLSALEMPSVNRSNLAAVLRIETTKKKMEDDISRRLADQEFKAEMKWRDHILRKKPAWQLVKNNHAEDIAMRLQTRRDEELLRRQEFLHEMELMYGRVQKQPLLFERYYTPPKTRRDILENISQELGMQRKCSLKRKSSKRSSRSAPPHPAAPSDSRKVSINETSERVNCDFIAYVDRMRNEEKDFSETSSFCDDRKHHE